MVKIAWILASVAALLALAAVPGAWAQQPQLRASVLSTGAGASNGGSLALQSTLGQAAVGPAQGTAYQLNAGFWFQARPPALVAVNQPPTAAQITAPTDGEEVIVGGEAGQPPLDPETPFAVAWTEGRDPEGAAVTYTWQLAADETFAAPLLSVETGAATRYETTLGALAAVLDAAGVTLGSALTLHHRVLASDGQLATASDALRIRLIRGTLTAYENGADVPADYRLEPNYPNPFNPSTTIGYALPQAAPVRLAVYDLHGREVAVLVEAVQPAGRYTVTFEAGDLASGIYLYRIEAGPWQAVRRLVLLK